MDMDGKFHIHGNPACRGYCTTNSTGPLDVADRVFKHAVLVYICLHGTAPLYIRESRTQTADVVSRQHSTPAVRQSAEDDRSALSTGQWTVIYGRRCFAVAGSSTWNSLPHSLRDSALTLSIFRRQLKTHFCEILTRRTWRTRDFYRAMHFSAKRDIAIACRLSVCPSVTLVNCNHIGWNSSEIISPSVSLGCSLFATPTCRVCSKGNTPKFGPKFTHPLLI